VEIAAVEDAWSRRSVEWGAPWGRLAARRPKPAISPPPRDCAEGKMTQPSPRGNVYPFCSSIGRFLHSGHVTLRPPPRIELTVCGALDFSSFAKELGIATSSNDLANVCCPQPFVCYHARHFTNRPHPLNSTTENKVAGGPIPHRFCSDNLFLSGAMTSFAGLAWRPRLDSRFPQQRLPAWSQR